MKVIVAIDDSPYSGVVMDAVCKRHWPVDTEFRILSVVEPLPEECECECDARNTRLDIMRKRHAHLDNVCAAARRRLEKALPTVHVHYEIETGDPKQLIVDAAVEWEADRILIGTHGHRVCPRSLPGSVSRTVATHAHCTVEVVRDEGPMKSAKLA